MGQGVRARFENAARLAGESLHAVRHLNPFFLVNLSDEALDAKLKAAETEMANAGYYLSGVTGRSLEDLARETHSKAARPTDRDAAILAFMDMRRAVVETMDVLVKHLPDNAEARKALALGVQGLIVDTMAAGKNLRAFMNGTVVSLDRHRLVAS